MYKLALLIHQIDHRSKNNRKTKMGKHATIIAMILCMAIVAVFADTKASSSASVPAPSMNNDDDLPDMLTPFAVSPSVAATIAEGPSNGGDEIVNEPDAGTDGAPASADQYAKIDQKYSGSASARVGSVAAAVVAAAAGGYWL